MDNSIITTLDSYKIKKGLSDKQISQLINYSAIDEGLNYTSDKSRFKDEAGFKEFSTHILVFYVLADSEDNLLGIIWFDNFSHVIARPRSGEAISEPTGIASSPVSSAPRNDEEIYGISFAIRLYGKARGKGLALPFTEKVMEDFKNSQEYKSHAHPKIWLAVSPENEPAVNLYRKLGFEDLEIEKTHNKLLMVSRD